MMFRDCRSLLLANEVNEPPAEVTDFGVVVGLDLILDVVDDVIQKSLLEALSSIGGNNPGNA
jgi:hypothetical protein